MFALVDCNNFYASCEKLFRPDLEGKPVVVLSNNDGCIVARSAEVKSFDLPLAVPFFKHKDFLQSRGTTFFSSNYPLYADISSRVLEVLSRFSPDIEQYSIDEAFIELTGVSENRLADWAEELAVTVKQWVGIDVSVGIARTKTLAKVANRQAKRHKQRVALLLERQEIEEELAAIELTDIWGISRRLTEKLSRYGVWSPLDLLQADLFMLRKKLGITVERTARELNNEVCIELEEVQKRKNIRVSRSFGVATSEYSELEQALTTFAAQACEKLRRQQLLANGVYVFIRSNKHAVSDFFSASAAAGLVQPSDSSFDIIAEVQRLLVRMYKPQYLYQKVGVMLLDLVGRPQEQQQDIFGMAQELSVKRELMSTIDKINLEMGRGAVRFASQGLQPRGWKLRAEYLSPKYTTCWEDIPSVRCV